MVHLGALTDPEEENTGLQPGAVSVGQPAMSLPQQGGPGPGGQPMFQGAPQGGGPGQALQPTPQQAPQQGPALGQGAPPQVGEGEGEVDPEIGRKVAKESKEVVDNASKETKKKINDELEGMFGKKGLAQAYEDAIERLGGEKKVQLKMSRKDWGLFLMDFGMRLAAASGAYNSQLGSAIGEAGMGAMQNLQGQKQANEAGVAEHNKEVRGTAMDLAKAHMDRRGEERDPQNIMWTKKGAFNMATGKYQRNPESEGGGIMQPGQTPGSGAGSGKYSKEVSAIQLEQAGIRPDIAAQVAHGGSPTPAEVRLMFVQTFDKMYGDKPGVLLKFPGTNIRVKGADPVIYKEHRDRFMNEGVDAVYGEAPALEPYGSAGRPGSF